MGKDTIKSLTDELQSLEAQIKESSQQIATAAQQGDVVQKKALMQRRDELTAEMNAVRLRLYPLQTAKAEADLEEASGNVARLAEVAAQAKARFDEARREYEQANFSLLDAQERVRTLRFNLNEYRRNMASLERAA